MGGSIRLHNNRDVEFAIMRIPWIDIGADKELHPVRVDLRVGIKSGETIEWCTHNPTIKRLVLGSDNPADLGWLLLEK